MTELDIMKRAKQYMDQLAKGIDPIGGSPLPPGSALDQERLSKCFAYVSGVLGQVLANGGVANKPARRPRAQRSPFIITPEQKARVACSESPVTLSTLVKLLNEAAGADRGCKLTFARVCDGLEQLGYLDLPDPATRVRVPSRQGAELGILREGRVNERGGAYEINLYTMNAQRFIVRELELLLDAAERQKQPSGTPDKEE